MTGDQYQAEFDALLGKLDEIADELRKLQERANHVLAGPGQEPLWEDETYRVVDLKGFALDLLERARWCPEPTWPRVRRGLVDELEARLWTVLDALARPELADVDDLEELLLAVEAQTCALIRKRAVMTMGAPSVKRHDESCQNSPDARLRRRRPPQPGR